MPKNWRAGKGVENCKTCGVKLDPLNSVFSGPFKKMAYCKPCYYERKRKYWLGRGKELNYRYRYKLELDQYQKLIEFQQGGCAICRKPCKSGHQLCVDHNHKTGEVRALLCKTCNNAIGLLQEDEDLIWNMLEYLKKTTWNKEERVIDNAITNDRSLAQSTCT
jgi:hypothetical protein